MFEAKQCHVKYIKHSLTLEQEKLKQKWTGVRFTKILSVKFS